jgi:hypothetical protein
MKPFVSLALSAFALALPLSCIVLLPCEEYQDSQPLLPNPANSSIPSNSTAPSLPSPSPFCSLSPLNIWSALESVFLSGAVSFFFPAHPLCGLSITICEDPHLVQQLTFVPIPPLISSSFPLSSPQAVQPQPFYSASHRVSHTATCAPRSLPPALLPGSKIPPHPCPASGIYDLLISLSSDVQRCRDRVLLRYRLLLHRQDAGPGARPCHRLNLRALLPPFEFARALATV